MITPILERLLLTGRAYKINKVHGLGASGFIQCPKDRWLIITSILYYPFFDIRSQEATDLTAGNMMNLRCKSKDNLQNYTFKNSAFLPDSDGAKSSNNVDSPPVCYDVFDIHKSDVILSITKNFDLSASADFQFNPSKPQAQNELPPTGYGISFNVARRVTFGAGGTDIMPQGAAACTDLTPTARTRTDYIFDAQGGDLANPVNNQNIPLVNFTVVIVNSSDLQNT